MDIKANDPLVLVLAIVLIAGAIVVIESGKSQMASDYSPSGDGGGDITAKGALFSKAPELAGISGYINAPDNISIASLRGKVVLVDFWTYSCINCIRTLPYLTAWDERYRDEGLVIIGVHTPEFEFEKDRANVEMAVEEYGIMYPVVQDNGFATWRAYGNRYWPRKYLIDAEGFIRYDHIGEGGYDETEEQIRELLAERDSELDMGGLVSGSVDAAQVDFSRIGSPELYLGTDFARAPLGNSEGFRPGESVEYALPEDFVKNLVYLEGTWTNTPDCMELSSDSGSVVLRYEAKNVNIVAGGDADITLLLDGKAPSADDLGADATVVDGQADARTGELRLYSLIDSEYGERTLRIDVSGPGFCLYTFTFG